MRKTTRPGTYPEIKKDVQCSGTYENEDRKTDRLCIQDFLGQNDEGMTKVKLATDTILSDPATCSALFLFLDQDY